MVKHTMLLRYLSHVIESQPSDPYGSSSQKLFPFFMYLGGFNPSEKGMHQQKDELQPKQDPRTRLSKNIC